MSGRFWRKTNKFGTKKQRHTARRIYERLVSENGYGGSERAVWRVVAALKKELALENKEVLLPPVEYRHPFPAMAMGTRMLTVGPQ